LGNIAACNRRTNSMDCTTIIGRWTGAFVHLEFSGKLKWKRREKKEEKLPRAHGPLSSCLADGDQNFSFFVIHGAI
jgi:hypothetical protein